MIGQLWGPLMSLASGGGYRAWTVGDWFLMKYANIAMYGIVAVLFVAGMLVDLPERRRDPK